MARALNDFSIDWENADTHILLNPKAPELYRSWVKEYEFPKWPGHIWVSSSGSTSQKGFKLYAFE